MRTVGVDLSAEPKKTWMATVSWTPGKAELLDLQQGVTDAGIVSVAKGSARIGIDCPFGWPTLFVAFVQAHEAGGVARQEGLPIKWRGDLANRVTDIAVRENTGLKPLSVGADRIAHVAFRCAAILADMDAVGLVVDRSGETGSVVEVYPAASLRQWGLSSTGYKRKEGRPALGELAAKLLSPDFAPWLDLGSWSDAFHSNDDAFDAVIAAMAARAAVLGVVVPPTPDQRIAAQTEGWIAVPTADSLPRLVE
jgi:predicted nuclease with RNAse H fold